MSEEKLYQQRISKIKELLKDGCSPEEIYNTLFLAFAWEESMESLEQLIKNEFSAQWDNSTWVKIDAIVTQPSDPPASPRNEPVSQMTQKQYEDLKEFLYEINAKLYVHTKSINELKSTIETLNKNNPYKELSEQTNKFFDIFISDSAKKSVYINSRLVEQVKNIMSRKMKKNANTSNILNAALLDVVLRNKDK